MINRYTQPINSQYIPTSPNIQMQAMLMQKKAQDSAQAEQSRAILENDLLSTKAYGEADTKMLQEISKQYDSQLSDIYTKYQGDPNAILAAMTTLNRNFQKEKLAGSLYDINKRYTIAMDTKEKADKALMSGQISQYGYREMMSDPTSGRVVTKDTQPLETFATKVATSNYNDDIFNGDKEYAMKNALAMFDGLAASEYQYMKPEEITQMREKAMNVFFNKYRNKPPTNSDGNDSGNGTGEVNKYIPGTRPNVSLNTRDIANLSGNTTLNDWMDWKAIFAPSGLGKLAADDNAMKRTEKIIKEKYPELYDITSKEMEKTLGKKPSEDEVRTGMATFLERQQARSASTSSFESPTSHDNLLNTLSTDGKISGVESNGKAGEFSLATEEGKYNPNNIEILPFKGAIKVTINDKDIFITKDNPKLSEKARAVLSQGEAIYNSMYDFSGGGETLIGYDKNNGLNISKGADVKKGFQKTLNNMLDNSYLDQNGNKYMYYLRPIEGSTEKEIYKIQKDDKGNMTKSVMTNALFSQDAAEIFNDVYQYKNK